MAWACCLFVSPPPCAWHASGLNVLDFLARLSRTKAWTTKRSAPGGASDPALDMGRVAFDARVFTVGLLARPDALRWGHIGCSWLCPLCLCVLMSASRMSSVCSCSYCCRPLLSRECGRRV